MTKLDFSDILKYIIMCFPGSLTMQWILKHFVNAAPGSAASVALHTTDYSTQQHRCWGSWVEGISGSTLGRLGYTHHTELQLPASPRYSCSCGCHWISLLQAAFGRHNRRSSQSSTWHPRCSLLLLCALHLQRCLGGSGSLTPLPQLLFSSTGFPHPLALLAV